MAFDIYSQQFHIRSSWPARREGPEQLADRERRFLDTLGEIDETLRPWSIGRRRRAPYGSIRHDLAALIARDIRHDEDGTVEEKGGYKIVGHCSHPRQGYNLLGHAGGFYDTFVCNELSLKTQSEKAVDTTIVTYAVLKAVTLTFIACWEPTSCSAASCEYVAGEYQRSCWLVYVPPAQTADIDLVGVPFSERTSDGGLLLSATDQTYDVSNPSHITGTKRIVEATRHLK